LGELHIAGKIEWRAYEQAEYVWKMSKSFKKNDDFLASHLRWTRAKLAQKISAYEETKIYLSETSDPDGINRFSHFEEFFKIRDLRERARREPNFLREFRIWVFQGKFPDAKDVRVLPEVLEHREALKVLREKTIQEAEGILNRADLSRNSDLYFSVDQTTWQLRNMPLGEVKALGRHDEVRVSKLRELKRALDQVADTAGIDLGN